METLAGQTEGLPKMLWLCRWSERRKCVGGGGRCGAQNSAQTKWLAGCDLWHVYNHKYILVHVHVLLHEGAIHRYVGI